MNREALVEAITREVLSALSTRFDMAETGSVLEVLWLGELPPPEKTIE